MNANSSCSEIPTQYPRTTGIQPPLTTLTIPHNRSHFLISAAGSTLRANSRRLVTAGILTFLIALSMLVGVSSSNAYPVQPGPLPVASGTLTPGGTVTLAGGGFAPGAAVSIYVYSTPTLLARTAANATGSITVTVTIPADLPPGSHTLQATGPAAGGGTTDLTTAFTVTAIATSPGKLPMTGFPTFTVLGIAAIVILLGGAFLYISRRRTKVSM